MFFYEELLEMCNNVYWVELNPIYDVNHFAFRNENNILIALSKYYRNRIYDEELLILNWNIFSINNKE